ncbi:glycosyltransferase family 4 protein [Phormidium tenue FACHB-886]|nr:glycosyltransferase family 4 protein [Phormidium tenue FACHB-886]
MHLIVLENEPSSYRGGQELSLLEVCRSLHKRGHKISLFYIKSGDLITQYQSFCLHTIALKGYKFSKTKWFNSASSFYHSARVASTFKNSVIYTNNYQDSLFGRVLTLLNGTPFVCHIRLPCPKTLGIQAKLGLKGAAKLITISNHTQEGWVQAGFPANQFEVIYNGVDLTTFSPAIDTTAREILQFASDALTICYVGRLDKAKGIETLLRAFAQIAPHQPRLQLLITGKPLIDQVSYQATLQQLVAELGIQPQVRFLGHIVNPAIVYHASDLAVLPSIWAEPFGRTLLESMACGVPIVASRVGGIPEVLTGEFAAGLFTAGDVNDLAQTLQQFINWRDRDPTLGQRCRQHVANHFSLERAVEHIERVLLETADCQKTDF